jgi:hypothetical protein
MTKKQQKEIALEMMEDLYSAVFMEDEKEMEEVASIIFELENELKKLENRKEQTS